MNLSTYLSSFIYLIDYDSDLRISYLIRLSLAYRLTKHTNLCQIQKYASDGLTLK